MALLFATLRPPVTKGAGIRDGATSTAVGALEAWATELVRQLSKLDVSAGGPLVGGVSSVTGGTNITVSPTTGAAVVSLNNSVTLSGTLTLSPMTPGSVLFAGAGGLVSQDNAHFFWDDTNNSLTVTTTTAPQAIRAISTDAVSGTMSLQNTNVNGPADFFALDSGGTAKISFGYGNTGYVDTARVGRSYIWRNAGVDFIFARTNTTDALLDSSGDWFLHQQLLVKGGNSNAYAAPVANTEFFCGRTNAGVSSGGQPDVAFQWGGSNGGYRHFISSWHDSVAASAGNRLRFHLNNSTTAGGSSTAGTGNTVVLDLLGNGTAWIPKTSSISRLYVGDDISLATNGQSGFAAVAFSDGNVYLDSKATSGNSTILRCGAGAEGGSARTWLTVTNSTGATSFNAAATFQSTLAVNGNCTLGDGAADVHTINGATSLVAPSTANGFTVTNVNTGMTAARSCIFTNETGSYNTTAGAITFATVQANAQASRSAGANPLTQIAMYANAAATAQVNYALYTDLGDNYLNVSGGSTRCARNFQVDGNTTLGDTASDTTTVNGVLSVTTPAATIPVLRMGKAAASTLWGIGHDHDSTNFSFNYFDGASWTEPASIGATGTVAFGAALDANTQLRLSQTQDCQYGLYHTDTTTGNAEDRLGLQFSISGSFDCTAAARIAYGANGSVTATRSAGANNLTNIGVYAHAAGGQVNYSFFGNSGTMRNQGDLQVTGNSALGDGSADIITINSGPLLRTGTGTPEGAITAPVGSLFLRTDGGAGTTLYVKESGAGNTGWVGK